MTNGVKPSHVYLAQDCRLLIKIGITCDIPRRLADLKFARGGHPVLIFWRTEKRDDARAVEAAAQGLLIDKHIGREWFEATPQEAVQAVKDALRMAEDRNLPPVRAWATAHRMREMENSHKLDFRQSDRPTHVRQKNGIVRTVGWRTIEPSRL